MACGKKWLWKACMYLGKSVCSYKRIKIVFGSSPVILISFYLKSWIFLMFLFVWFLFFFFFCVPYQVKLLLFNLWCLCYMHAMSRKMRFFYDRGGFGYFLKKSLVRKIFLLEDLTYDPPLNICPEVYVTKPALIV